jgi:glycosyltransferase involved in cell wall biosynthesis
MILIDSLYINNGGGKVLLDYLVLELEQSGLKVFYLFDERCKGDFREVSSNRRTFLKASIYNRYLFYKKNRTTFDCVCCFANLAPPLKIRATVFTYFHQKLFLSIPKSVSLKQHVFLKIKILIFRMFLKNSNYWIVQSKSIRDMLSEIHNIDKETILTLPFYPPLKIQVSNITRIKNSFIYVSNASAYKNHKRLIDAFCMFYDRHKTGKLTLTVSPDFDVIFNLIKEKVAKGYPINNIGFVRREELATYYQESEYLIFPSLAESFGLGIVEAIENGCKVIGSNLPYMNAVCNPSITFEPNDVKSISKALEMILEPCVESTSQILFNEIDSIIKLFKENTYEK